MQHNSNQKFKNTGMSASSIAVFSNSSLDSILKKEE
jgi:hypothetical protein